MRQLVSADIRYNVGPHINHCGIVAQSHWLAAQARDLLRDKLDGLPDGYYKTVWRYMNLVRKEVAEI
jgi:hypothetical protein